MWTRFMDMHSGGGSKEDFEFLAVELPEDEAVVWFYNHFGHSPYRVSCTCCGDDYSVGQNEDLKSLTAYDRNLRYAEDKRGWNYNKEPDYLKGRYLEPDEDIPDGMQVSPFRGFGKEIRFEDFISNPKKYGYRIVRKDEINPVDTKGDLPQQGYVWVD